MKEFGPDGDLIFSSKEFGSGSVTKTELIADILRDLLDNTTITMKSEETKLLLEKYYLKLEVDNLLTNYVSINKLASEVKSQLNTLLNDPEFSGKYASQSDLEDLNELVIDWEETIETILGNQASLQSSWTEYKQTVNKSLDYQDSIISQLSNTVNDLRTSYDSLSSSVSNMQSVLNNLNLMELSDLSKQISEINAKLDKIGELTDLKTNNKDTLVNAINELVDTRGDLDQLLTTDKTSIVTAINELFQSASDGKSLIAAAITGKGIPAAATDTFSDLANKINSISSGGESANITQLYNNGQELNDTTLTIYHKGSNSQKTSSWIYLYYYYTGVITTSQLTLVGYNRIGVCIKLSRDNSYTPFFTKISLRDSGDAELSDNDYSPTGSIIGNELAPIDSDADSSITQAGGIYYISIPQDVESGYLVMHSVNIDAYILSIWLE